MSWKHFNLINPVTKSDSYCVNSYGALSRLDLKGYETVWLNYQEIEKILNSKTKQEKYSLCDKLFNKKFLQSKKDKKDLSKQEQSKLEKLFP